MPETTQTRKALFPRNGCAIIVGASGGMGQAITRHFAAAGCHLLLTYHRHAEPLEQLVAQLPARQRDRIQWQRCDNQKTQDCAALMERARTLGGCHTLVNATGADIPMRFIGELTPEQWQAVIDRDLNGAFQLFHHALPLLRETQGSIVQVSSVGLNRWPKRDVLSVAPKAGIEALLQGIAKEEGRYGVRANSVRLGVIDGGIFHRLQGVDFDATWVEAARNNTALKRFGSPDDVAKAVRFLASREALYITGQHLCLDGGFRL